MTITRRSWRKLLSQRMKKKSTVNLRKRYLLSWNDSISRTSNGEKTKKDGRGGRNSTNCRSLQT